MQLELTVKCNEDTWIIKGFEDDFLFLWHNNYIKTDSSERYITDSFNNQEINTATISELFDYIHEYSYEKHLAAEKNNKGCNNEV